MNAMSHQADSTPITGATLEPPIRYNVPPAQYVYGDIWNTAWADDDILYVYVDDTRGWQNELLLSRGRNLAISSFGDSVPSNLLGRLVNSMDAYGHENQLGDDGACWKADGIYCVDGVLYLTVSRHWYGKPETGHVQITRDATIVRSQDHGLTWTPTPPPHAQPFPHPTFPGRRFATPFFVQYGKDGAPPTPAIDAADEFVYAISSDGCWDNGNAMYLGRVARGDLPNLDASQWAFYTGTVDSEPTWESGLKGLEAALPILEATARCGQAGIQFIPALNRYILPQWSYPELSAKSFNVSHSIWEFYEAPHPWGPWTLFQTWDWPTQGYYNPNIPNKFIDDDGHRMWILTTGDFFTHKEPPDTTKYTLLMMRMTLHTGH